MIISGIYLIKNMINKKIYVGSSNDIFDRWKVHIKMLTHQNHHSKHLQRAVDKYGIENFDFEILMFCDPDRCLFFEQKCLDVYKPWKIENGYNVAKDALSPTKGIPRTLEEKNKISESMKNKHFSNYRIGDKTSMFGKHHKNESKNKIRFSQPKRKPIERIDLVTGEVKIYDSISLAGKEGFSRQHIFSCLKNKRNKHKGYGWQYL